MREAPNPGEQTTSEKRWVGLVCLRLPGGESRRVGSEGALDECSKRLSCSSVIPGGLEVQYLGEGPPAILTCGAAEQGVLGGLGFLLTPRFWAVPIGVAQEVSMRQTASSGRSAWLHVEGERIWPRALWRAGKGSRLSACARSATPGEVDYGLESVGGSRTMGRQLRGCSRRQALRRYPPDHFR